MVRSMAGAQYSEFKWELADPGNGRSGAALAQTFIKLVSAVEGVERVCDLGCGNGHLTGRLAALGYEVTGIDASESGIRVARENCPGAHFICDFIDGTLIDRLDSGSFDLVISSDAIEHFYRPADLIEATVSLLKPGGHALIGTPYHGYWKNLALSLAGKMDDHFDVLDDGGHIKFFSVKTLWTLLANHGFSDIRFSFYGRAPWLWKNMICHARKIG